MEDWTVIAFILFNAAMIYSGIGVFITFIDVLIHQQHGDKELDQDVWSVLYEIGAWPATILKWIVHAVKGDPL